jgi:hypothetical protein
MAVRRPPRSEEPGTGPPVASEATAEVVIAMWQSSTILGMGIQATDGSIGSVSDLLFDDSEWTIRWAVVDTGTWLPGRKVLLPSSVLGRIENEAISVGLTRRQVHDSPDTSHDQPISRQMEANLYGYYGWSPYWYPDVAAYPGYLPPLSGPVPPVSGAWPGEAHPSPARMAQQNRGDPSLRSVREVSGYYVQAKDDSIGHVEDFLVEQDGWTIRYIIVDTRNWWPGRKVVISPRWIRDVRWNEGQVHVTLTRQEVEHSPEYDPTAAVDRDYEERLHGHYRQQPYWPEE